MKTKTSPQNRRSFIKRSATITSGLLGLGGFHQLVEAGEVPPKEGLYELLCLK